MSWMARFASSMSLAHSKPQLSQHIWWINHYSSCIIIERKTQKHIQKIAYHYLYHLQHI
jgi:hypothetical protein